MYSSSFTYKLQTTLYVVCFSFVTEERKSLSLQCISLALALVCLCTIGCVCRIGLSVA